MICVLYGIIKNIIMFIINMYLLWLVFFFGQKTHIHKGGGKRIFERLNRLKKMYYNSCVFRWKYLLYYFLYKKNDMSTF